MIPPPAEKSVAFMGAIEVTEDTDDLVKFAARTAALTFTPPGLPTVMATASKYLPIERTLSGSDVAFNLRAGVERHARAKHRETSPNGAKYTVEGFPTLQRLRHRTHDLSRHM